MNASHADCSHVDGICNSPAVASCAGHVSRVAFVAGERYPWRPSCSCGAPFRGYVNEHAARTLAECHVEDEL